MSVGHFLKDDLVLAGTSA